MDRQQQVATKRIHRYLSHDTLIATSAAKIHIYYSNEPGKPYLLMLHGMGMNGKTNWTNQVPALSKQFNLVVPDLIYFGESTSPSGDYSPDFQAAQIHEAIALLNVPKGLNVAGFSYGGLVAALYNNAYGSEIHKLVIIDAPLKFYSIAMCDSIAKAYRVPAISHLIIPENGPEFKAMQSAIMYRSFPVPKGIRKKLLMYVFDKGKQTKELQMNYLAAHESYYQQLDYGLATADVLFIWGKKDGIIPLSVGENLHKAFPNSKLLVIKKAKHDAPFGQHKKVNRAITDFIKLPKN